jgi:hypothetical protein
MHRVPTTERESARESERDSVFLRVCMCGCLCIQVCVCREFVFVCVGVYPGVCMEVGCVSRCVYVGRK